MQDTKLMKVTDLETANTTTTEDIPKDSINGVLHALYEKYKNARSDKEEVWKECWASYLGTPVSTEYLRSQVGRIVGDVNDDWRHRINTGKAYEIIETVNAYLQGAFFPNREWFDLVPKEPGLTDIVGSVKKYIDCKLKESNFRSAWEMYTRQLLITGFSAIALPWVRKTKKTKKRQKVGKTGQNDLGEQFNYTVYEPVEVESVAYNNAQLQVLDVFDLYIDPLATNIENASMFRIIRKTKGEVLRCISSGLYPLLDGMDVVKFGKRGNSKASNSTTNKKLLADFLGVEYDPNELVEIMEFWGSVEADGKEYQDVVATLACGKLARFQKNPYWGGRPFILGVAVPIPNKAYGLGVLEPVLGMLHQLNIITNQRLDSLELSIDAMYLVVNDGVVDPEDVYTAPGKVIEVGKPDSVVPLQKDRSFMVSYQEAQLLERNIDQTVGTGAYIGTQQGRSGERVTATEIQAVRDAGGNRLSSIHAHIEQTQLIEFLEKLVAQMRQFITDDDVVRMAGSKPRSYEYVAVGAEELSYDYDIEVVGADYVADRERDLQKVMDFIQVVGSNPAWQQQVDWESMLRLVIRQFGFDTDTEQLIVKQEAEGGVEGEPQDPQALALQQAQTMGGDSMKQFLQGQMAAQGGNAVAVPMQTALSGASPESVAAAQQAGQMMDVSQLQQGLA